MFANLGLANLKLLAFASEVKTYDDLETVFESGERADSAYLIVSGAADVIVADGDRRAKVNQLKKDEIFGEMALFLSAGRSASIVASGPLVVLKLEGSMFLKMVSENPKAAFGVMTALSEKILGANEQILKSA